MTWTKESLRAELIKIIKHHYKGEAEVNEASHLIADLSIDSLGVFELVADIEDAFNLRIPDDALRDVDTIEDVAHAVEHRLRGEGRFGG